MNDLKLLLEQRADKESAFEALVNLAKGRELTEQETKQLSDIEDEIEKLDVKVKTLEKIEARSKAIAAKEAAAVGAPQDNYSEAKEYSRYSYAKAFKDVYNKKQGKLGSVQGLEREINDEAQKEAEEAGITLYGNISVPSRLVNYGKRILTVTTEGADVVRTEYKPMIPALQIDPVIDRLGITKYLGLKGNLLIPRATNNLVLVWETEVSAADEVTLTFDSIALSPKRLSGYHDVSLQMLAQSNEITEQYVMGRISFAIAQALDLAVIAGPTGGNGPVGILNFSGVNVTSLGSSGGDMTYGALVDLLTAPMADNARDGRAGWLINTNGYAALLRTPKTSGGLEGNFILQPADTTLFGRPFIVTNRIPSDLTETATGLSGAIYSPNWSSAILATWGGASILFDPYTQAGTGTVRFVVNTFADVDLEHPEEFAVAKDWVTTTPAIT